MTILELLIHCNNHDEYECPKVIEYHGFEFIRCECNNNPAGKYYFYETKNDLRLLGFISYTSDLRETFEIIEPAIEVKEPELIPLFDLDDYTKDEICERVNMVIEELNKLKEGK